MLQTTLDNGLKVIVEEHHASKVVAAQVWVRVGSADETPDDAGLAHVHEHMLFKGTARRKVGEIAADVEAVGGDINAWTSFDQTVYHVTMPSRELDVALDILADAVQHSAFDAEELKKELEVVLEELRRGKDTPSRVASEMIFSTAYKHHTYGRPVIGFQETVEKFTREQILAFYRRFYQPRNMCLVVVGDVDAQEVVKKAERLFEADLNQGADPERGRVEEPPQAGLRVALDSQDIQETHLNLAWPGTALHHEDTPALDVLSVLLGSGESSRLYARVKREQQLVADTYAYAYTPQDRGIIMVGGQIQGPRLQEGLRSILKETLRLCHEKPDPAEIEKARTILLSDAVYSKETVQGIARKLGYFELVAGDVDFEVEYYEAIRRVTAEDVRRVACKYLGVEQLSVAALMPTAHAPNLDEAAVRATVESVIAELAGEYATPRIEPGPLGVAKVLLENGATLLVLEDDSVPLVSVRAAAQGGLLAETDRDNGVTHLTGELVVRGTERYSADQIIQETDAMAGGLTGQSGRNSLGLRGDFLKESWERGFELFASCLLEPVVPQEELDKEKQNQLEDIQSRKDSLSALAFEQLARTLFGAHPYHLPVLGTEESVGALTREDVLRTFRTQLRPDQLTLCVVGAVDVPATVQMVQARVGRAKPHPEAGRVVLPAAPLEVEGPRSALTVKDKAQAHLALGFLGVSMDDPRRPALEVLSSILGGQSGRLFLELRDKLSLAYSVGAFSLEGLARGYFSVYIGTSPEKLATAEAGIRAELQKIIDTPVEDRELTRAIRYLVGAHEISLQRASARCSTMALNEAYHLGYDEHARYAARVEAVTAKAVQEVARDIIRLDRAVRSVVAPG
ncbi:MAG: insulinase family protein [Deltaproteobacteria bacterium]|nr:insulinase family protein [Deltaproteobacteria bacterium]